MRILIPLCCAVLPSCAYYSLQVTTPDGLTVQGRALVMNESDDVSLTVDGGDLSATFGKQKTDAGAVADVVGDIADRALLPGLL